MLIIHKSWVLNLGLAAQDSLVGCLNPNHKKPERLVKHRGIHHFRDLQEAKETLARFAGTTADQVLTDVELRILWDSFFPPDADIAQISGKEYYPSPLRWSTRPEYYDVAWCTYRGDSRDIFWLIRIAEGLTVRCPRQVWERLRRAHGPNLEKLARKHRVNRIWVAIV